MKKFTLLIIVSLLSICGYAQLPPEGFENPWVGTPAAPPGWTVINELGPAVTWVHQVTTPQKPSNTGSYSAFLDRDNVCPTCLWPKDWLITPYFNMPANAQLRFFSRLTQAGDDGGIYKVKISTDPDPANLAAYTDLQTWTELSLNPLQQTYTEKVLTLPAITGSVHIAFVMEAKYADRWLIDDVKVVSQCIDPSNLTISNITLDTAQLNWTNNGTATQWEIEVIPDIGMPTGTGVIHNGPPPFTKTNLLEDTAYKAYVRAKCSDGGESGWIGPIYFYTEKRGERCAYPIQVASIPYSTTDNTAGYANNYLGTPGAIAGCVAGSTYLNGNDVVYEYTPTVTGNVNISLTGAVTGAALLVYDNCTNIGVSCLGGGTGNATIPNLAVTAGNNIIIVISSNTAGGTTPYTLSIQQVYCAAPTGLASANPTQSSADISWAAGVATSWELAVQPAGTGLPAGSGIAVNSNNLTVSQTVTGASFNPATNYEFYVRSNCNNGTYSIWSGPFNFSTTQIPAGIPYAQDWETTPNNWSFSNGTQVNKWVVGGAVNNGGSQSLYISNDNGVNNIYTLTSASVVHAYRDVMIPAGATSLNLAFDWKSFGDSADYISAFLVPVTVTPVAGTQVSATAPNIKINSTNLFNTSSWNVFNGVVNVTGMGGTPRRLVLQWVNNASAGAQNPAAIDNINFTVITCPAPTSPAVVAGTLTGTSVNINWTAPTSVPAEGYEYYISTSSTPPTASPSNLGTSLTTTAVNVPLTPSVTHYFWVRAKCGTGDVSTWAGPLSFIAPQIPANTDYTQNFDLGPHGWGLSNGTQTNKWVVGSATSNSATNSLYISQDNGVTNGYNQSITSVVHAYRDITIPTGVDQLELTFDWKNMGETADYVRVWLAPTSFNPTPGTLILAANATPVVTQLFNNGTWTTQSAIIQGGTLGIGNSTRRLIFEWRNDAVGGVQPPAAIDNINLKLIPCPQPSALALTNLNTAGATFTWTAPASAVAGYQYYYSTSPTAPTSASSESGTIGATTVTIPGLLPSTTYYMWVRSDCTTSKSYWIGPVSFLTPQTPASMDYSQNFDSATPHGWDLINGTQANKWVVGSATSNSATNSLYISQDNGTNNTYNIGSTSVVHAYRDITIPNPVDQVVLTFDWKGVGEASLDYFKIWLVPTSFVPVAGTAIVAGTGRVPVGTTFLNSPVWQTSNILLPATAFQGQQMRLVFEWRNSATGGAQTPAAIDNINFKVVTCPAPTNLLMPSNNSAGVTFTWTPPTSVSPSYDYYYSQDPTPPGAGNTVQTATVPTASVTMAGLPPSSNFYFWVRSNCGANDRSLWLGPFEFNTPQMPVNLNYTENFDSPVYGWTIKNGNQTNKWVVGNAVNNGGGKSLYVSDNNGLTNTYTITAGSVVHAYKDFNIPSGTASLDLAFDWRCMAQTTTTDYIKVWRVPASFVPTTGTLITAAGDRETIATLSNNANWTTASYVLNSTSYAGGPVRIIFEWRNDTFTGTQPPGAIDNIDLRIVTCPKPSALGATAITQTGATFNWTESGTASNWEVYVVPAGQPAPTDASTGVSAPSNPFAYTTPALQPSTNYVYYVRAVCATDNVSKWVGPYAFKTSIGNDECTGAYTLATNPVNQDCQQSLTAMYTGATASPQPFNCGGTNGADIWYQFVATSDRHTIELSAFTTYQTAQPVIIELYQGETCGSLLHVGCATTNVMRARNLVIGATYKVRLYINATTPDLNTGFTICVNTPGDLGDGGEACVITTINASFETPAVPGEHPQFDIDHNSVQGWRTTASDEKMEFWPVPNYEFVEGYDGEQFVELNANLVAGLYQDYQSPEGTVFNYSFGHRGRRGLETCEVQAGPPTGPFVTITTATTGNTAWATYTGTYTTPPNQPVTRFIFKSVTSAPGQPSVGNFLDGIEFTADNSIQSVSPMAATCADNVVTVIAAGIGEWGAYPDNPSPTLIDNSTANTTTITGFAANGDYWYSWTTADCSSAIKVTYDNGSIPSPAAIATIDFCVGETAAPLEATAINSNILQWYTTATGGTADTVAPTPDTSVPGTTVYYVSQRTTLECESPRTSITVNVHAIPAAPVAAATAIEYCEDTTATALAATALAGNTLNWYTEPTGGTASTTAPTPSTTDAGVTSYYVSQVSPNSCESDRTEIVVTVNASIIPVTDFTFAVNSVCIEDVNPVAIPGAGMTAGGFYSSQPAGLVINPATGEISLNASTAGTYTVTYTITADPSVCNIGNSSSAEITIVPLADAVTGFSYTTPVCSDTANQLPVLQPGFTTGGIFTADNGLVIDPATGEVNIAASPAGITYTITYTVDQSVPNCMAAGTSTAGLVITPVFTPVTAFDYEDSFCYDASDASPNLADNFTTGGTFTGTSGLVIDSTTGLVNVAESMAGEHTVTYTTVADPANCIYGGSSSATFTIGSELVFSFKGQCEGSAYVVTASPANGSYDDNDPSVSFQWSTATGTPIGTDSHILNVTEYANSTPGNDSFPMELLLTVTTADGCDTTRPFIVDGIGCTIQKGISPNNDGMNDYFDLEFMGVKKLSIYNRYGQDVYTKENYKNEWIGQTNHGDELPTGTYYFVIERSEGGTDTGWIYINRQD